MSGKRYILIATFLLVTGCAQPETLTEAEQAEIVRQVKATLENYYSDIRKEGLTAEFKYLDNSQEFFWVPPGYTSPISYDSVAAILKQNAQLFKSIDNSFDTLHIVPLSMYLVTYTGRLRSIMIDTSDQTSAYTMMETGVLIKRKDGWKLLSGQTSLLK
ncbi:MAG TPA: hypothetical protein VFU05_07710 [Cyclobacteriaceae bacterium]|nr:hypothetical protein [Cyclobacteriaceae bacterium]